VDPQLRPMMHGTQHLKVARRLDPVNEFIVGEMEAIRPIEFVNVDAFLKSVLDDRVVVFQRCSGIAVLNDALVKSKFLHALFGRLKL